MFSVNTTGTFLGIKCCAPLLKKAGKSAIVNTASVAGMTGYFSTPYTASKWAIRGLTKSTAMEYADWGIRINSVNPGFIHTPATCDAKELFDASNQLIALNRSGHAREIAKGVLFLASDDASYMTGTDLVIDGGLTNGGDMRMIAKEVGIY